MSNEDEDIYLGSECAGMIGTDIKFYGSGASNLGGAIGSLLTSNSLHNLFDAVGEAETVLGSTEYRCIYVKTHTARTLSQVQNLD